MMTDFSLEFDDISGGYGGGLVVRDVSASVSPGKVLCVLAATVWVNQRCSNWPAGICHLPPVLSDSTAAIWQGCPPFNETGAA